LTFVELSLSFRSAFAPLSSSSLLLFAIFAFFGFHRFLRLSPSALVFGFHRVRFRFTVSAFVSPFLLLFHLSCFHFAFLAFV
jgi:hypothetical protein